MQDQSAPQPANMDLYAGRVYANQGNPDVLKRVPESARRVLDIGCGNGANAAHLARRGCEVWGVTLSDTERDLAAKVCHKVLIANVETEDLDVPENYFDAIVCSHILEHLVRPDVALTRLARHLAPGGVMVLAVPNMANFRSRWRLLRGNWQREDEGFFDRTHLQFWSYKTFATVLKNTGLQLRSI